MRYQRQLNSVNNTAQVSLYFKPNFVYILNNTDQTVYMTHGNTNIPTAEKGTYDYPIPPMTAGRPGSLVLPTEAVQFGFYVPTPFGDDTQVVTLTFERFKDEPSTNFLEHRVNRSNPEKIMELPFTSDHVFIWNNSDARAYMNIGSGWYPSPPNADIIILPHSFYNFSPMAGYFFSAVLDNATNNEDCIFFFVEGLAHSSLELLTLPPPLNAQPVPDIEFNPVDVVEARFAWENMPSSTVEETFDFTVSGDPFFPPTLMGAWEEGVGWKAVDDSGTTRLYLEYNAPDPTRILRKITVNGTLDRGVTALPLDGFFVEGFNADPAQVFLIQPDPMLQDNGAYSWFGEMTTGFSTANFYAEFPTGVAPNELVISSVVLEWETYPVQFTNTSLNYVPSEIMSLVYAFGDGDISSVVNPIHTYLAPGDYDVILTIEDVFGNISVYEETISVAPGTGFSHLFDFTIDEQGFSYAPGFEATYEPGVGFPSRCFGGGQDYVVLTRGGWDTRIITRMEVYYICENTDPPTKAVLSFFRLEKDNVMTKQQSVNEGLLPTGDYTFTMEGIGVEANEVLLQVTTQLIPSPCVFTQYTYGALIEGLGTDPF
jgi:hypothetical protein